MLTSEMDRAAGAPFGALNLIPQLSHREPGEQEAAMALDKGFLQPLLPHPPAFPTAHVPSESTAPRNHNWNNRASLVGAELCMGAFMLVTHLILSNP